MAPPLAQHLSSSAAGYSHGLHWEEIDCAGDDTIAMLLLGTSQRVEYCCAKQQEDDRALTSFSPCLSLLSLPATAAVGFRAVLGLLCFTTGNAAGCRQAGTCWGFQVLPVLFFSILAQAQPKKALSAFPDVYSSTE